MFDRYKQEATIFTFDDYAVLISEAKSFKAKSVLEFGPGVSTDAWIEAGVKRIVCLEHDMKWLATAKLKFGSVEGVELIRYFNTEKISVPELGAEKFDIVFVDSPVGIEARSATRFPGQENCSRLNTMLYALQHAPVVLLHDAKRPGEQATLARLREMGFKVTMIDTVKGFARVEGQDA